MAEDVARTARAIADDFIREYQGGHGDPSHAMNEIAQYWHDHKHPAEFMHQLSKDLKPIFGNVELMEPTPGFDGHAPRLKMWDKDKGMPEVYTPKRGL